MCEREIQVSYPFFQFQSMGCEEEEAREGSFRSWGSKSTQLCHCAVDHYTVKHPFIHAKVQPQQRVLQDSL